MVQQRLARIFFVLRVHQNIVIQHLRTMNDKFYGISYGILVVVD